MPKERKASSSATLYLWALVSCACVASVYLLPQVLAWKNGFAFSYFLKVDEPAYAARVVRFLQGFWKIGNPWTFENRNALSLLPALPEWVLGSFAAFLCISVDTLVWLSRGVLSALGTWLFWRWMIRLGAGPWVSLLSAVWAFADPGVYDYKPLAPLWNGMAFHPLNRFSNPLFGLPLFFASLRVWSDLFISKKVSTKTILLAGTALGLFFYVSVYYWAHLFIVIALALVWIPNENPMQRRRDLLQALSVALLVSLPYWVDHYRLRHLSVFSEMVWRTGILIKDRGWYLLGHKGLWASLLVLSPLYLSRQTGQRFLGLSILAGALAFFSSPLTGVTLQNFHWHYTLAPLCFAGYFWVGSSYLRKSLKSFRPASWIFFSALLLPLFAGWSAGVREYRESLKGNLLGVGSIDQSYGPAWNWLRRNATPDSVVLTDPHIMGLVPVRSGLRIWQNNAIELVPSQDILERNQVLWYLENLSFKDLFEQAASLATGEKRAIPQWTSGLPVEVVQEMRSRGFPGIEDALNLELAHHVVQRQKALSLLELKKIARKFRLDYLVLGRFEKNWPWQRIEKVFLDSFQMKKVFEEGALKIYQLSRRVNEAR